MLRTIASVLFLIVVATASGQSISATETLKDYSVAQKRLLAINTAIFINFLTQNNLDQDSVMTMACYITGMPSLLPYNEAFGDKVSEGTELINAKKISKAQQLLNKSDGEKKIQLLIELGVWYLHKPGTNKADLDSANLYTEAASKLSTAYKFENWQTECRFLQGQLFYQKGNIEESENTFNQLISSAQLQGKMEIQARAYAQLAKILPDSDTAKFSYFKKSLELYQHLQLKEKEIELLISLATLKLTSDLALMEINLHKALTLMQSTGFKHVLYTQNMLAYANMQQVKYLNSLEHANAALENMQWSHIEAVAGSFFYRLGAIYESFGQNDRALLWFKKALDTGTAETHLFWYKSLFFACPLLGLMNRPGESLALVNTVTQKSPPATLWEKMQTLSIKGECYEKLNKPTLADRNYMSLFKMANDNPSADPYGELSVTYIQIAKFYVSQHNLFKARLFLKRGLLVHQRDAFINAEKHSLLYKIDSLEGNFKSAMENHIKYKLYYDFTNDMDQKKKLDELTIKYAAEKKDQDIKLLRQQGIAQQAELKQNKLTRNIMIAGTALLLIIVGLLFSQFKLKQRTNKQINKKNLALQHLVEEKEWLLKEVHHRVKNNLHTVICLLESQAAYLENDALKAIENSQHRIYAMSLIHQKLYQSEDVKTIDMSVYLPEFIRYLDESFGTHYHINFQVEIEPIKLGLSQAIPVALIINEAVTNSIKYAFPQNRKGIIEITMRQVADQITLSIADDGIGIDPILAKMPKDTLGLKLINGLSEDINATIRFKTNGGTKMIIIFNVDPLQNESNILSGTNKKEVYT